MPSPRSPLLISVALHGAIVAALIWLTANSGARSAPDTQDHTPRGAVDGSGILMLDPALGPSITPALAAAYLGHYRIERAGRADGELLVTHQKDADDHWSLVLNESGAASHTIKLIAPDSFVARLNREYRVVFIRRDNAVSGIQLSWAGSVRRGVKVATSTRD